MNNNIIAVIDVGTSRTTAILGRFTPEKQLDVLGMGMCISQGVKSGIVINIQEAAHSIKTAMAKAIGDLNIEVNEIFTGVSGQRIYTKEARGYRIFDNQKVITKNDIQTLFDEAKRTQIQSEDQIYHIIPQAYTVDNEPGIKNPVGIPASRIDATFQIVAGSKAYIGNLEKAINLAGYRIAKYFVNSYALGEAFLSNDEKEVGAILLDLGAGVSSLSIYHDNLLKTVGHIPIGGELISNDIKTGCSVILRHAERLKVSHGYCVPDNSFANKFITIPAVEGWPSRQIRYNMLAKVINARMSDIMDAVNFLLEKSKVFDEIGAGIVICGGGSSLKKVADFVSFKSGMDVRMGKPLLKFSAESKFNESHFDNTSATILGLTVCANKWMQQSKHNNTNKEIKQEAPAEPKKAQEKSPERGLFGRFGTMISSAKSEIENLFTEADNDMN